MKLDPLLGGARIRQSRDPVGVEVSDGDGARFAAGGNHRVLHEVTATGGEQDPLEGSLGGAKGAMVDAAL